MFKLYKSNTMKNYKQLLNEAESLIKDVTHTRSSHSDSSDTAKLLAAAVVGLAVGGILGILFAPSAGTETRSTISDSVNNLSGTVREKARQGLDRLADLKDQAVDTVKSRVQNHQETESPV